MTPANSLAQIRQLAASEDRCIIYTPVLDELRARQMDTDDLLEIIASEIGEAHCFKVEPTAKYYAGTTSDYYSIWIDVCGCHMFLKLLVASQRGIDKLVITSFKRDDRHV